MAGASHEIFLGRGPAYARPACNLLIFLGRQGYFNAIKSFAV